jgi:hypothetical protein
MDAITQVLRAIEQGDPQAASQLLPLVYDELRKLAAERMANERPGQTLEATALVHEAYLRLLGNDAEPHFNGRGHFFPPRRKQCVISWWTTPDASGAPSTGAADTT